MGSLLQRLSAAMRAEADVERIYMMGFGEQWRHFHLMLISRSASTGLISGERECWRWRRTWLTRMRPSASEPGYDKDS